jgi:hypothetical protein
MGQSCPLRKQEKIMSILANLAQAQKAHQQQPLLTSVADLVAEYDAVRRAYAAAMARNNVESALLWSRRANSIAREMAFMQDPITEIEDGSPTHERQSA